jgi:hypothetical protein
MSDEFQWVQDFTVRVTPVSGQDLSQSVSILYPLFQSALSLLLEDMLAAWAGTGLLEWELLAVLAL